MRGKRRSDGIRTIRWDPNHGFFLNGRRVFLKGTNNHQDHAGVGTALPDRLQEFRIERLKAMGSNAYRTAHHPPTPELLDACDRLGMLVIDENRLMGSNEEALADLERLIVRDRNHPSVILWSLGNEEWAIENEERGARIAKTMQAHANRFLAHAVMREESAFDPEAVSPAAAYGLMQLIVPTARQMAKPLGLPYEPDALKRPRHQHRARLPHAGAAQPAFQRVPAIGGSRVQRRARPPRALDARTPERRLRSLGGTDSVPRNAPLHQARAREPGRLRRPLLRRRRSRDVEASGAGAGGG